MFQSPSRHIVSDGVISGTGFTPHSSIVVLHGVALPSGVEQSLISLSDPLTTDASGAFMTTPRLCFCFDPETTTIVITATDAEGVTRTQSFTIQC